MIGREVVDAVRQSALWSGVGHRLVPERLVPCRTRGCRALGLNRHVLRLDSISAQHAAVWLFTRLLLWELKKMVVVDPKIVVRSERLLLRALTIDDAADVLLMRKHPEVMKHT